ncbi:MAG: UMP kinase [Lentisphaeria bacterium]|jgi:uridylate kinase
MSYKRILLKLTGETLKGGAESGIVPEAVAAVAEQIREVVQSGLQVALVVGAGNLFRGLPASKKGAGLARATADAIGMLATVMNALALRDALEAAGTPAEVLSAIPIPGVAAGFDRRRALALLEAGSVVLLAGGTGHPFFTTDTTAALRACELGADAVFKATKVAGVYTADPTKDPAARRFRHLAYDDALARRLEVMDAAAFSLCRDNGIEIVVFNFFVPGNLRRVAAGDTSVATVVGSAASDLA